MKRKTCLGIHGRRWIFLAALVAWPIVDAFQSVTTPQRRTAHAQDKQTNTCLWSQQSPVLSNQAPPLPVIEDDASVSDENDEVPPTPSTRSNTTRFLSPLLEYGYRPAVDAHEDDSLSDKPILLYLPGFDGTFLSPFLQLPELHTIFDVRCLTMDMDDRSTFHDLKATVLDYLLNELPNEGQKAAASSATDSSVDESNDDKQSGGGGNLLSNLFSSSNNGSSQQKKSKQPRPVYLAGESFGGILASEVALELLEQDDDVPISIQGLTLINAATCYDRSRLAAEGPAVAEMHPWLYPIGLTMLLQYFADDHSWNQLWLILQAKALPSVIDTEAREAYLGRVALSLPFVLKFMPQETLRWRLHEWLTVGCAHVSSRLAQFQQHSSFRVAIIAGEHDTALPSIDEAERLASIFPESMVHVVEGAGHATTCGSRIDMAAVLRRRFRELRRTSSRHNHGRTSMKEVAAQGTEEYLGMEPRYDGATIGLNPLRYWHRKYYRRVKK